MIGYRLLIIILCAIFLALGIGIMLGDAFVAPAVTHQQVNTLKALASQLDTITRETDADQQLLKGNQEAISALAANLVDHKLDGKRYAIIQTGDYPSATQDAASAITAAGGSVSSVTVLTSRLTELDAQHMQQVAASLTLVQQAAAADTPGLEDLLRPLVVAVHAGTDNAQAAATDLNTLAADGLLDQSGDYSQPVSGLVIVGGSEDDGAQDSPAGVTATSQVEQALLSDLSAMAPHLWVVGCEPFDAVKSSLPDFDDASIASVDCIDLPLGALDLPFALTDGDHIAYGVKSTATQRIPVELTGASLALGAPDDNEGSAEQGRPK